MKYLSANWIIVFIVFLGCDETKIREAQNRPSDDGAETPGFDLETIEQINAGKPAIINLGDSTSVEIYDDSIVEDATIRLRRLVGVPERESLVDLGTPVGDVVEILIYNNLSTEALATDSLGAAYSLRQKLSEINNLDDLKLIVLTSPGMVNEELHVLGRDAVTIDDQGISLSLATPSISVLLQLGHAIIYAVEAGSDAIPASIVIQQNGETIANSTGTAATIKTDLSIFKEKQPDTWTDIPTDGAPSKRAQHAAVWGDGKMYVWGGATLDNDGFYIATNTGSVFDPATNKWEEITTNGAPSARHDHKALWVNSRLLIWGGRQNVGQYGIHFNDGSWYDPATKEWQALESYHQDDSVGSNTIDHVGDYLIAQDVVWTENSYKFEHTTVYSLENKTWEKFSFPIANAVNNLAATYTVTPQNLILWGGKFNTNYLNSGWRFSIETMAWEALTSSPEAAPREGHSAVWTGDRLLMWGGYGGESTLVEHATELNIDTGIVKEIAKINKPFFKGHCAFWGNDNMILWGGKQGANYGTSLSYSPITNTWKEFSSENAPEYREGASCVWTGQALIIWGGQRNYNNLQENSFDVLQNTGSYYIPF